jgi:hypothetical protein
MVSAVGDSWRPITPGIWPLPTGPYPGPVTPRPTVEQIDSIFDRISRAEFEALKREIEELKQLLTAAKKFDEATGQKDCEMEDKVRFLKQMAKHLGVDLSDVFDARTFDEEPLIRN